MQPRSACLRIVVAVVAIHTLAGQSLTESFETRYARDIADNPSDLHFVLDTADGQRSFRIGERIPLTLAFSSDTPRKYKLNAATYDRSGRLPTEEFIIAQADITDPYLDYFGAGVLGWIAGGLRGYPVLEAKPYKIDLDLNDWFRFDRPGQYRFYLKSHRLTRERAPGEAGERVVDFAAVSNVVELTITDDPAWQTAKLADIRPVLDQAASHDPDSEKARRALRDLRYLGTPSAIQLVFEYARASRNAPDTLTLFAARDRKQMLVHFDRYLADPQVGIREWDVRVRALFTQLETNPAKPLPVFRWQMGDPSGWDKLRAEAAAREERFKAILRQEAMRLIPLVARKDGEARKVSGKAIEAVAPEAARAANLVPPENYGLSRKQLIAQFAELSAEQQSELLGKKWDLIRGPEMVPVLEAFIERTKPKPLPDGAGWLRVWGTSTDLTETAARRIMELAPGEAARIVKRDLANGSPRLAGFAVREFPAQSVPEADKALSELLKTKFPGPLLLIAKFATVKLAGEMRARYENKAWACDIEDAFVTYFVRLFPDKDGEGRDMLRKAMADRERRGCYRSLLKNVAAVVWNPAIEAQAIATLDDSDPETAAAAAEVLAAHGDAGVEKLLWRRLEQWSQRWRGRAAELEVHPITESLPNMESRLGSTLSGSIATARSWVLDEPRRKRLLELCIDDQCRERWSRERPAGAIPLDISNGGDIYPAAFRVEGYTARSMDELKYKLAQYPSGTAFRWCPQEPGPFNAFSPAQREEMFRALEEFVSTRSMRMESCSTAQSPATESK